MRDIYLLRSGEYMPLLISLPPTSIKPFKEFLNRAFVYRRRATYGSLVQISLKKENNGSNDYSVATFRLVRDFQGEESDPCLCQWLQGADQAHQHPAGPDQRRAAHQRLRV